jgi:hypothetical protein
MRILSGLLGLVLVLQAGNTESMLRVGYYQSIPKCKTTICIDTYGKAVIYEGSLEKVLPLSGATYSVCVETPADYQKLAKGMDFVDVDVSYGALRSR